MGLGAKRPRPGPRDLGDEPAAKARLRVQVPPVKVLLVEDDPQLAENVQRLLCRAKHRVDVVGTLSLAKAVLAGNCYEVVLLDRLLPDGDGTELIDFARRRCLSTRFIIVSALGDTGQRVEGLDHGADDYITKPFEPAELNARIRAATRRPIPDGGQVLAFGNLRFNVCNKTFTVDGKAVALSRRTLALMEKLIERSGQVVTRDTLEMAVYGYDDFVQSNALEAHVSRLRKDLVEAGANVQVITIRGVGYMLRENAAPAP